MQDFLNSLNVVFEPYHSTTLQWNEANKVMLSLDSLESLVPTDLIPIMVSRTVLLDSPLIPSTRKILTTSIILQTAAEYVSDIWNSEVPHDQN